MALTTPTIFPPAPPEEDNRDACCGVCSSVWHPTENHDRDTVRVVAGMDGPIGVRDEFPPGYDPGEADRLIGREPHGA